MNYTHISGYKFTHLNELGNLQKKFSTQCALLELKGTILLSTEGINLFLCGTHKAISLFCTFLNETLGTIDLKKSPAQSLPFKRLYVKIKPEIVTFGVPEISPEKNPAPAISPEIFKQWQDEGKAMVILDARNNYEIQMGKFAHAIHLNIEEFRSFAKATYLLPHEFKDQTVVTYCTGGIRCEKAAPYLIAQGFKNVYQLEGGILKYMEKCGSAYFEGNCFVFDNRIAVNSTLQKEL